MLTSNSQQMCLQCRNIPVSSRTKRTSKAVASTSVAAWSRHHSIVGQSESSHIPCKNCVDSQSWKLDLRRNLIGIRSSVQVWTCTLTLIVVVSCGAMTVLQTRLTWFWGQSNFFILVIINVWWTIKEWPPATNCKCYFCLGSPVVTSSWLCSMMWEKRVTWILCQS